jgi:hypothetical protein
MGFLDGLLGGGPSLEVVPLDPQTQQRIGNQVNNAAATEKDFSQKYDAGVAAAGDQAKQTDSQFAQRSAQTGEDQAGLQAIRNQYNKAAGDAVSGILRKSQYQQQLTRNQLASDAARSAIAKQQVETSNYEAMTNAMNQADAARASIISNILGVGGMVAGAAIAGGGRKKSSSGQVVNQPNINDFNVGSYSGPGQREY